MNPQKRNREIASELTALAAQGLLTPAQLRTLAARYPTRRWDVRSLVRWFTLLGALSVAAGSVLLAKDLLARQRVDWRTALECALGACVALCIWLGLRLPARLPRTAAVLHLGAGFALQGLIVAYAVHHATGSKNWPALVGICCAAVLGLAYALQSRLVLVQACVNLFVWFGGETGYVSGWGMYWLGMTYPLRFALGGLGAVGIGFLHFRFLRGALQGFSRVYAHFGLLVFNLALWFFALFGWFEREVDWDGTQGQRLAFSALWAVTSALSLLAGSHAGLRILRSYGLVFLVIDIYTFYFQFIAVHSPSAWFLHLLLAGGSLLALGTWIDRLREAGLPRGHARITPER